MTPRPGRQGASKPSEGTPSWAQGVAAVRRYTHVHHSADVPARAIAAGVPVGRWVAARREDYWAGLLSAEHTATLECLPGWVWGQPHQNEDRWNRGLAALNRYRRDHNSVEAPHRVVVAGVRVRTWVQARRTDYRATALTPEQIASLEALPGWSWQAHTNRWERGLRAARAHINEHGSLTTTETTVVDGFALGRWIIRVRADHRAGTLTPAQADVLQALPGWDWGRPGEGAWRRGLRYLRAYVAQHGTATPPVHTVVDTYPLGQWVTARRRDYRAGRLRTDRVSTLQALPGWTWHTHHELRWRHHLAALRDALNDHGSLSAATASNAQLGQWVQTQRTAYRAGTLRPNRTHALQALPGWEWHAHKKHT